MKNNKKRLTDLYTYLSQNITLNPYTYNVFFTTYYNNLSRCILQNKGY